MSNENHVSREGTKALNVVLVSTYELGRQPFGLASPVAWLKQAGTAVTCLDLAVQPFDEKVIRTAELVAFYLPMHTATRLVTTLLERVRAVNPSAHICCYGLYAPVNEAYLRELGAGTILGGEFESGLVSLARRLALNREPHQEARPQAQQEPIISLDRQRFLVPDRGCLPPLEKYARLRVDDDHDERLVGYTEASRGCKHLCRHCPIVPVYGGKFRVVQLEIVLDDIRTQVELGAEHITFGDPDFFNAPGHAIRVVESLHEAWPGLTYDVTIKIEHLLKQARRLTILRRTGCLFVTSAVESIDDQVLAALAKNHTRGDFIEASHLMRAVGLTMTPTFVTFNPWTTIEGYRELLDLIVHLQLVGNVSPIQYAIRLLIPAGSKLLELPAIQSLVGEFDQKQLCYPWVHPDPRVDDLHSAVLRTVKDGQAASLGRHAIFRNIQTLARQTRTDLTRYPLVSSPLECARPLVTVPYLTEPWYC